MKERDFTDIHRGNIRRNIAVIASLAVFIAAGAGFAIEEGTNHTEECCPLCHIFGMKHQANAINNNPEKYPGYSAEYLEDYDDNNIHYDNCVKVINNNNNGTYTIISNKRK